MSFTLDTPNTLINVKLTEYAREQFAKGTLSFRYFALGDSEIDYTFGNEIDRLNVYNFTKNKTVAPKDRYPSNFNFLFPGLSGGTTLTENRVLTTLVRVNLTNTADERGFFTGTTTGSTYNAFKLDKSTLKGWGITTPTSGFSGTRNIVLSSTSGTTLPSVGDRIFINFRNPLTAGLSADTVGDLRINNPTPIIAYQIESFTGSSYTTGITVTLDRFVPNFTGYAGALQNQVYLIPGRGAVTNYYGSADTTSYWDSDLLSFNNNCIKAVDDVSVWNMNIPFKDSVIGTDIAAEREYLNYSSATYNGFVNFTLKNVNYKSQAIIHYTNNSISNFYGEYFIASSVRLSMPTVQYDRNTTMGLELSASTTGGTISGVTYFDLRDPLGFNVGKVWPAYKIVTIEDEEIVAAMSYKSNRNYTLPELTLANVNVPFDGLVDVGETVWFTYRFTNPSAYTSGVTYGFTDSLPCQKFVSFTPTTNTADVQVRFPNRFPFMRSSAEMVSSNGTGWNGQRLEVLVQKTAVGLNPEPNNWRAIDMTSTLQDYASFSGSTIPPSALTGSTSLAYLVVNKTLYDAASSNFFRLNNNKFNNPTNLDATTLGFGDEEVFLGNIRTDVGATTQKTSFICRAPQTAFFNSRNPTYQSGATDPSVYISEAGIYDDNQRLVVIGKFNKPIKKDNSKNITITLDLDF